MTVERTEIIDQAIDWHVRQRDMDALDWTAFVEWLEASPVHAEAYDNVVAQDQLLPQAMALRAVPAAPAIPFDRLEPRSSRRRVWLASGGALAAAAAAWFLTPGTVPVASARYVVASAAGERQEITLGDGTRIEMNGGTRIELDRANTRVATLIRGEAVFHVRHDTGAPFRLTSGNSVIEDVGTVFNAARLGARLDVQVAEGAVRFDPSGAAIVLREGSALSARDDLNEVIVSKVDVYSVGGWRSGRIAFTGETMELVAAALERRLGAQVIAAPDLAAAPFTGVITLTGSADRDVPHVAALVGATWRRDGERWVISRSR